MLEDPQNNFNFKIEGSESKFDYKLNIFDVKLMKIDKYPSIVGLIHSMTLLKNLMKSKGFF